MRALVCAAVFAVCLVPGLSETRTPPSSVTIVYRFDDPAPELVFREMKSEIRALLEPSSLRPEWRNPAELSSSDRFENLVVVDFHGRCRTGPSDAPLKENQPLGRTQVVDGEIRPFIDIQCDRVQASLNSVLWRQDQNSSVALGRALARVLAHELYHVLAGTAAHSRTGIAKPALSGTDLASQRLEFTPSDVELMKSPHERLPSARLMRGSLEFLP